MTAPGDSPRSVVVTGSNGTVGVAVVGRLAAEKVTVTALDAQVTASAADTHGIRQVAADVTDEAAVTAALHGADAVVHLAAIPHPTLGSARQVFTNNTNATFTVLAAAAAAGIRRAVIASSINASGVNLNPGLLLPAYFPIDENLPADIADAYSLSKAVDEMTAAMAFRAWGINVIALRLPLVRPLAALPEFVTQAAANPAEMVRTGWAYLAAEDAAAAVWAALRVPVPGSHVIGLSAADTLLATPSEELLDRYAPGVPRRRRFAGNGALVATTRAQALLSFYPRYSVHEMSENAAETGRSRPEPVSPEALQQSVRPMNTTPPELL
jgi:nucleoside-diphosphate-sugar epimerase